ncbi:MAG: hypothetical protein IIB56_05455 [Planctomycetes bacterium]|nr:hypothetical protein [Planctomycetota bacterium]MCH8119964.1 hypothetical protein [Planctomycetota bacterium]
MKKLPQSKKRGSAIPLAVVAVVILLAMGMGLLRLGLNSRIFSIRIASDIAARCAADAGLTTALLEMNKKLQVETWDASTLPQAIDTNLPNCDAVFSYSITGDPTSGYTITSVGTANQAQKTVYATLGLRGLFEHAILTKGTLILKANTVIDGYNSLDPLDTDIEVDIGTQSTLDASIILNSGVIVEGNVIVGTGGDPDTVIKDTGATTGYQYSAIEEEPLLLITPPALYDWEADITATGEIITLGPADSGQYGNITLTKGGTVGVLEISGGDVVLYITGNIDLGESCELVIKYDSSLTVYIDGDIHCRAGSSVNNEYPPENPTKFKLYGTSETTQYFDLKAKSTWSAVIYAPNADIDLYANGDFYGSVVADSFELKAGGNYHYDEALREVEIDDEGVRFVVKRWRE